MRANMSVKSAILSLYINTDIISLLAKDDMRDSKIAQNRKQMFGDKVRVMQGVRARIFVKWVPASHKLTLSIQ